MVTNLVHTHKQHTHAHTTHLLDDGVHSPEATLSNDPLDGEVCQAHGILIKFFHAAAAQTHGDVDTCGTNHTHTYDHAPLPRTHNAVNARLPANETINFSRGESEAKKGCWLEPAQRRPGQAASHTQ